MEDMAVKTIEEPCDVEAEASLLSSLLVNPDNKVVVSMILSREDFGNSEYGALYERMMDIPITRIKIA